MSEKRYPDEFNIEAVKQATAHGHSLADVAKRLVIPLLPTAFTPHHRRCGQRDPDVYVR